ncbi:MAG: FAD-dependent oxidoreductase [Patescibacteria group bacterium]|nr:FAD-dependent oxidoreductase [Patescibacteria group bacterium]
MAILEPRKFRVTENRNIAEGVFGLKLVPADGAPLFVYSAGQFVMLHLQNPDGTVWAKAAYSIANAPAESDGSILLAIRLRGDFTHRAELLKVGDTVLVQGPYGRFVMGENAERNVMLAAGIGITPIYSMLREKLATDPEADIVLLYSNRDVSSFTFLEELEALAEKHKGFSFVAALTGETDDPWKGERGRIDEVIFRKYVSEPAAADYYLCGPSDFVTGLTGILESCGVNVKIQAHKEVF